MRLVSLRCSPHTNYYHYSLMICTPCQLSSLYQSTYPESMASMPLSIPCIGRLLVFRPLTPVHYTSVANNLNCVWAPLHLFTYILGHWTLLAPVPPSIQPA